MSDDPKLDFYLQNRTLIEEWAKLREPAARGLDRALLAAVLRLTDDEAVPNPGIKEERFRTVWLQFTTDPLPDSRLELYWEERNLMKGSGGWPQLALSMDTKHPRPVRDAVKNATGPARDAHGMTSTNYGWWLRHGEVRPPSEPIAIEEYAEYCVQRLREAWLDLHAAVSEAVERAAAIA